MLKLIKTQFGNLTTSDRYGFHSELHLSSITYFGSIKTMVREFSNYSIYKSIEVQNLGIGLSVQSQMYEDLND